MTKKPSKLPAKLLVRRRVNLTIRADYLEEARQYGINLSQLLEQELITHLRQMAARLWQNENRKAIEHFNTRVERDGPLNSDLLAF